MQSSSVLFSPFHPPFFSFFFSLFFFFKDRWKEWVSEGVGLTPVSVAAQAREVVGNDPLAAIWNCPPSWLGRFDWWRSFVQPYGRTSWRAGREVLVPAVGRGTKSLSETRSLREEEPLTQNYASRFTVLSARGTRYGIGGRQGLARPPGMAGLSCGYKEEPLPQHLVHSVVSSQGLFTRPPLYLPKPKISLCYKLTLVHPWKSHCSTRRTGFVQPGLQPRPEERRAELPGWGPLM